MKCNSIVRASFGMILALGLANMAGAQSLWTSVASACAVDESDQSDWAASYSQVGFKTGASGYVTLRYNVTNPEDDGSNTFWDRLYVTYRDPDGTGTASRVRVFLRRASRTTGSIATIATFDSNTFSATGTQTASVSFSHSWSFYSYYYFLETELYRSTGSTADVKAVGYALQQYFGN